jgi:hypothetical protein
MLQTDLCELTPPHLDASAPCSYHLFMCTGGVAIAIDKAEERYFVFGQLAVLGIANLALAAAIFVRSL